MRAQAPAIPWRAAPAATLMVLASLGAAEEGGILSDEDALPEDMVRVRDFHVVPAAQLEYSESRLRLHPKVAVATGYNSNVYASDVAAEDDVFVEGLAGLEMRYWLSSKQRALLDLEVDSRVFLEHRERTLIGLRLRADYEIDQSDSTTWRASARHERLDDPLIETGRPVKRGDSQVSGQWQWGGAVSRLSARAWYAHQSFIENDPSFTARERTSNTVGATAAGGYRTGSASEFTSRASAWHQDYLGDGTYQDHEAALASVGWRTLLLTRVSFEAEAGAQVMRFEDDFDHDPSYDDRSALEPVGGIALKWDAEQYSYASLRLYRELTTSVYSNSVVIYGLESFLRYRMRVNAALVGSVRAYRYESSGAPAGSPIPSRNAVIGMIGGEYALREGLVGRLTATQEGNWAEPGSDYRRSIVKFELAFAY